MVRVSSSRTGTSHHGQQAAAARARQRAHEAGRGRRRHEDPDGRQAGERLSRFRARRCDADPGRLPLGALERERRRADHDHAQSRSIAGRTPWALRARRSRAPATWPCSRSTLQGPGQSYCRQGCGVCESSCPHGVPISEVLRTRMYATHYGDREMAGANYDQLAHGCGGVPRLLASRPAPGAAPTDSRFPNSRAARRDSSGAASSKAWRAVEPRFVASAGLLALLWLVGCGEARPRGRRVAQLRQCSGAARSTHRSSRSTLRTSPQLEGRLALALGRRALEARIGPKRVAQRLATAVCRVSERIDVGDFQGTPLMVEGRLYGITSIGQVFALDAASGRELWLHDPESYRAATQDPRLPGSEASRRHATGVTATTAASWCRPRTPT